MASEDLVNEAALEGIEAVVVKTVYKEFNPKLVQSLPLNDPIFIAELTKENLFYGSLREQVMSPASTRASATAHFLYNAIECPLNIEDMRPFYKLLNVMENFDNQSLNMLARQIKQKITATHFACETTPMVTRRGRQPTKDERERMKIAVESGDTTAVRQMIIDDHIDVNADISPPMFKALSFMGLTWHYTALHQAVKHEQLGCIKILVERGADLNKRDCDYVNRSKRTPIERAVGTNSYEIVHYLYQKCHEDISGCNEEYQAKIKAMVEAYARPR